MKIYLISILLLLFVSSSFACDLTDEYKKVRSSTRKEILEPYKSCVQSTRSYFYYQAVAKCKKEGKGKNIGGGCFHVVGYQQTHTNKDIEHCKIFKPNIDQMKEYFKFVVERDGIEKCLKK